MNNTGILNIINIEEAIQKYEKDVNNIISREKSWELCFDKFKKVILQGIEADYKVKRQLALELVAFLASFGMYRNSIVLKVNYLALVDVVTILIDQENSVLIEKPQDNIKRIMILRDQIINSLVEVKEISETDRKVTDTLVSKIMLGSLGCVVAYDERVCTKLKKLYIGNPQIYKFTSFSVDYLYRIYNEIELYRYFDNHKELTPMREMDILLWYGEMCKGNCITY